MRSSLEAATSSDAGDFDDPGGTAAALPWLLLLPALAFAWIGPGAPLADDPYPHLTGTAIALLAAIPLACLLPFVVRSVPPGFLVWLALWAIALLLGVFGSPDDGFEARRTTAHLGVACLAYAAGAALDARGRRVLALVAPALSVAWVASGLATGFLGDGRHYAGVLGDSGTLSQCALPGAAIGAWFLATRKNVLRGLGAVALGAFLAHAVLAPVHAGAISLLVVLLTAALLAPGARRGLLGAALVLLLAVAAGSFLRPRTPTGPGGSSLPFDPGAQGAQAARADATNPDSERTDTGELGGVGVRLRVWSRIPALLAKGWLFGVGPGQFQAAFPPFRDPREIEISRHGICSELTTEVEHAHADLFNGLAELGVVGGGLLLAALALAARSAVRALRQADALGGALGAAALAVLANGLLHAPLFRAAPLLPLALGVFGALASRTSPPRGRPASRWMVQGLTLAVVASIVAHGLVSFAAPGYVHGRSLSRYIDAARSIDRLSQETGRPPAEVVREMQAALRRARAAVRAAIQIVPDSVPAASLLARLGPPERGGPAWDEVLRRRPYSVEALSERAFLLEAAGQLGEARALLSRALELSPTHPRLLFELARIDLVRGDARAAEVHLAALRANGCAGDRLEGLGQDAILSGRFEAGARVLFSVGTDDLVPEELAAAAAGMEESAPRGAAVRKVLAHLLWARQQAAGEDPATAVRSYRQAWNACRAAGGTAPPLALELAAAELAVGRREAAEALAEGLGPSDVVPGALPDWAVERLGAAGLLP